MTTYERGIAVTSEHSKILQLEILVTELQNKNKELEKRIRKLESKIEHIAKFQGW